MAKTSSLGVALRQHLVEVVNTVIGQSEKLIKDSNDPGFNIGECISNDILRQGIDMTNKLRQWRGS